MELFWVGIAFNLAGLAYMAHRLATFLRDAGVPVPGLPRAAGLAAVVLAIGLDMSPAVAGSPYPPQVNREGGVTVKVTPLDLAPDKSWRFEIVLDTHSADLGQDLATVAVLVSGDGREFQPVSWEGSPPGGHHRKGVLEFASPQPLPASATLKITGIGAVAERVFTWPVDSGSR